MTTTVDENENIIPGLDLEGCTCLDEFTTTYCPVHPPEPVTSKTKPLKYGQNEKIIVTDNDMSEQGYGRFEGYIFICPSCGVPAVMVNPSMGKFCCNCGVAVEIRSKTITAKIRSMGPNREPTS
jgi:hypothetical protein